MPGGPAELTLDVNEQSFRVLDSGIGPAVLLLHGIGGTRDVWREQVPALVAGGFRVLAPDLRGFAVGPDERRNIGETIDDIRSILRTLGVPRVHVVGQDRGAEVAWMLALTHSKRVDRVVVLGAGYPDAERFAPLGNAVMAIWGSRDDSVTEATVRAAAEHVAGPWRFERLEDTGAAIPAEQPARLNALLLDFLAQPVAKRLPTTEVRAMVRGKRVAGGLAQRLRSSAAAPTPEA